MSVYMDTRIKIDQLIKDTYVPHFKPIEGNRPAWHTQSASDVLHIHSKDNGDAATFGKDLGHYSYIPYDAARFVDVMLELRDRFPSNGQFVDVGCGIGDKLLLANAFCGFPEVSGIEYDPTSVEIAKATVGSIAKGIIHADANTVDFSKYTMIYLYCPIQDMPLMRELYIHIANTAPQGAIIAEMYPVYAEATYTRNVSQAFKDLFEKLVYTYCFVYRKDRNKLHHVVMNNSGW